MSQGEQKPRTNPEKLPTDQPRELQDEQLDQISGGAQEQDVKTAREGSRKIT